MTNIEGLASKQSFLSWLSDYVRDGKPTRYGLITNYRTDNQDHFINGKWQARNIIPFLNYIFKNITNNRVVKGKGKAELFSDSIKNKDWYQSAASLAGIKLLEELHAKRQLKSVVANALIDQMVFTRVVLGDIAKTTGRIGKNQGMDADLFAELQESHKQLLSKYMADAIDAYSSHAEMKIFEKYRPSIQADMDEVQLMNSGQGAKLFNTQTDNLALASGEN
jgi:hypothetical protein